MTRWRGQLPYTDHVFHSGMVIRRWSTGQEEMLVPPKNREVPHAMSKPLWCDKGEHTFSSKDPERHHFEEKHMKRRESGNSYGQPVYTDDIDLPV